MCRYRADSKVPGDCYYLSGPGRLMASQFAVTEWLGSSFRASFPGGFGFSDISGLEGGCEVFSGPLGEGSGAVDGPREGGAAPDDVEGDCQIPGSAPQAEAIW
jgi:hypothetical protein